MNHNKPQTLFVLLVLIFAQISFAANQQRQYTIPVKQDTRYNTSHAHRAPVAPVICIIDIGTGVSIEGVNSAGILTYSIYSEDGENCIVISPSESEFLSYLQNQSGTIQIRFSTEDCTYVGYLTL